MQPLVFVFMRKTRSVIFVAMLALLALSGACRQSAQSPSSPTIQTKPASSGNESWIRTDIGFASRRKLVEHYEKHGGEFGSISQEEYLRQAQSLRDRAAGGDVLEATRADGVVTRFDRKAGAFLAFNSDLTIRTYFKPNDGEAYFKRQSKRGATQRPKGDDNEQ